MKKVVLLLSAAAVGLALASVASPAHALGPIGVELGAKLGGGSNLGGASTSPLYFPAVGGRGGITYHGFYGGVSMIAYAGQSVAVASRAGGTSAHSLLYGVEGGYGVTFLEHITLRAQVGLGNAEIGYGDTSSSYFYLEPGVLVMARLAVVFVGVDLNMLIVPAGPAYHGTGEHGFDTAVTSHLQLGVMF